MFIKYYTINIFLYSAFSQCILYLSLSLHLRLHLISYVLTSSNGHQFHGYLGSHDWRNIKSWRRKTKLKQGFQRHLNPLTHHGRVLCQYYLLLLIHRSSFHLWGIGQILCLAIQQFVLYFLLAHFIHQLLLIFHFHSVF